jgi:hypothetical protein
MADTTLVLDGPPKTITLSATTVSRIVVPVGTRYLVCSCGADWYHQVDLTQAIADGAAITAANAQLVPAGMVPMRVDGSVGGNARLPVARYVLVYGSAASTFYVRAVSLVA